MGISAGSSSDDGEKSGLALGQPVLASIVNGHDRYVNAKQAVALATEHNVQRARPIKVCVRGAGR